MTAKLRDSKPLTHRETMLVVLGVLLPVFMGSLDNTILASALPTIGREFGDVHNLPWLVTAYLIANTAITALYGKISDIHGRRVTLLIAISLYMLGSLVCALAPNMFVLILGRVLHGLGGGGLDLDRHGGAGRHRGAEGPRQVLRLFLRDLHHRRRLRAGARRRHRRISALVGDLLDEHPARPDRDGADADAAAPPAAARAAAQARLPRRRADHDGERRPSCWRSAWAACAIRGPSPPILALFAVALRASAPASSCGCAPRRSR